MSESTLPSSDPGTQKRRSTRIVQAVPITVSGVDALGQPFKERTTTVMVNCHGCKYQSKHYVPKNSIVTLEIPRTEPAFPPRIVPGHVVWVQRPRTVRELFQIGLEFEAAGNVWGIAFPPEDWLPCPEDEASAMASLSEIEVIVETKPAPAPPKAPAPVAVTPDRAVQTPASIPPPPRAAAPPAPPSAPPTTKTTIPEPKPSVPDEPAATVPLTATTGEAKIHVMPSPAAGTQDAQIAIARQMAKIVAEAKETLDKTLRRGAQTAINEEMTIVRQQLDAQMHETVEHAIKSSMERMSEAEVKKVVQQAANKTAAIVEEARLASQANTQQIDAKVREAVQQAVSEASARAASQAAAITEEARRSVQEAAGQAAQQAVDRASAIVEEARRASDANAQLIEERVRQAAQEAATLAAKQVVQQAIAQDVKLSIEEMVGRVIAEREANVPSLQVLTSPEAARQHLDEWKRNLEETAHNLRGQMVVQTEAEAEAASRRWREELETMLAGSSQRLGEKLSEVSQAVSANAQKDIAERSSGLRALIDEVVSGAQAAVLSLGAELAQQRGQTENARIQLQEAATTTIEQTRRQTGEMTAALQDAIARRTEEVIAEHIRQVEPALHNSAHQVIKHFSAELDLKIAPKLDEVQRAVSEIGTATGKAAELQANLQEQVQHATEQAAQIQSSIRERVQQVSDSAVQKAVFDLTNIQQQTVDLQNDVRREIQQAAEQATHIQSSIQERAQAASDAAVKDAEAKIAFAGQETARLQDGVRDEIRHTAEQLSYLGNTTLERVQAASSEAVGQMVSELESARQQAAQLESNVRGQVEQAGLQVAEIENQIRGLVQQASERAAEIHMLSRERVQQSSEQTIQEALERMKQETAKFPGELEQACRVTISKLEEELDQKSSEMQHSAYEALLKSSEWYQKKAQTSMHSTMERVIDQSANAMREKAGEISSMVASELDHYRRSYVEHSRAEIEEVSKEVTDRERSTLNETADIAHATFTDRVQHVAHESLRRFQEVSREALEKARSDMEFNRECSLAEFQKILDEKMTQGVEQAGTYLQSQLIPLLESWEGKREAEKQEWMVHLKKSSEESLDTYKARLENTTNAWLLASAATLGQNSQVVLDSLAKTAEKRMHDTCSLVLAGMGDVLKDKLIGISTDLLTEGASEKK